jgi:hypothetical protein
LAKVNKTDTCWLWTSAVDSRGYTVFWYNGRNEVGHRMAYLIFKGYLPKEKYICHTCDNKLCVNPAHLWEGFPKENTKDMYNKGRNVPSSIKTIIAAKLSPTQVHEIKDLLTQGISQYKIAETYNISQSSISRIKRKESWKNL